MFDVSDADGDDVTTTYKWSLWNGSSDNKTELTDAGIYLKIKDGEIDEKGGSWTVVKLSEYNQPVMRPSGYVLIIVIFLLLCFQHKQM